MQPSLLKKIIFSLVTVLAFFFFLEIGSRLGVRIASWHHDKAVHVQKERSKPAGSEFVVFVYGESTVFGEPLPETGFVRQLEFYFGQLFPQTKVRVVNFGACGMSSTGVLETLQRTIPQKPDLVIVLVGHNEFLDPRVQPHLAEQFQPAARLGGRMVVLAAKRRRRQKRGVCLEQQAVGR